MTNLMYNNGHNFPFFCEASKYSSDTRSVEFDFSVIIQQLLQLLVLKKMIHSLVDLPISTFSVFEASFSF